MSASIVLFDLGRVVLDWEPARLYAQIFDNPADMQHFLAHICTMEWHTRHDAGVSFADNADALIAEHPQFETEIRAWGGRWMEMFDGYIDGTPDLISRLTAAGAPLYALSNMPTETWPLMLEHFPVVREFAHVVVSGDLGIVKPAPEIYAHALEKTGAADASDVLFIDDSLTNIEAAKALGFGVHHFQGAIGLERALVAEGLL